MWILRYLNGYGDLVEFQCNTLDEAQNILENQFEDRGGPFSFKMIYKPKELV